MLRQGQLASERGTGAGGSGQVPHHDDEFCLGDHTQKSTHLASPWAQAQASAREEGEAGIDGSGQCRWPQTCLRVGGDGWQTESLAGWFLVQSPKCAMWQVLARK